ncbi:MAG: ankyrin repeat domain-containing protein [Sphingobacteriia bacterium]|nr:ankyrin repeat domain-containing protein [Sphingobacteriia bacterium]
MLKKVLLALSCILPASISFAEDKPLEAPTLHLPGAVNGNIEMPKIEIPQVVGSENNSIIPPKIDAPATPQSTTTPPEQIPSNNTDVPTSMIPQIEAPKIEEPTLNNDPDAKAIDVKDPMIPDLPKPDNVMVGSEKKDDKKDIKIPDTNPVIDQNKDKAQEEGKKEEADKKTATKEEPKLDKKTSKPKSAAEILEEKEKNKKKNPSTPKEKKKKKEEVVLPITPGTTLDVKKISGKPKLDPDQKKDIELEKTRNEAEQAEKVFSLDYRNKELPAEFYYNENDPNNRHLPKPVSTKEYVFASFVAIENHDLDGLMDYSKRVGEVNFVDDDGNSLLIYAAMFKAHDIAKWLIKNHVSVNLKNRYNANALHAAVINNDVKMVKILLNANVSINVYDQNNKTPLDYAMANNNKIIVNLLKKEEASHNPKAQRKSK